MELAYQTLGVEEKAARLRAALAQAEIDHYDMTIRLGQLADQKGGNKEQALEQTQAQLDNAAAAVSYLQGALEEVNGTARAKRAKS